MSSVPTNVRTTAKQSNLIFTATAVWQANEIYHHYNLESTEAGSVQSCLGTLNEQAKALAKENDKLVHKHSRLVGGRVDRQIPKIEEAPQAGDTQAKKNSLAVSNANNSRLPCVRSTVAVTASPRDAFRWSEACSERTCADSRANSSVQGPVHGPGPIRAVLSAKRFPYD